MSHPNRPPHYIREWRKHRNLTQERLALRLGKTQGWVSQIERFEIEYTQGALHAIADALMCEPADLLRINPLVEGEVIDITALLRGAPEVVRNQALAVVTTLLQTGTGGGSSPAPDYEPPEQRSTRPGGRR